MRWKDLARDDAPGADIMAVIGALPKRWGRMDLASRVALVAVGRLLRREGLLGPDGRVRGRVGLVAATVHGSMAVDIGFCRTLAAGDPSPMLFGYTLANIPLAEAAVHYGLTGPVYAVYGSGDTAREEAARILVPAAADMMIAGTLDVAPDAEVEADFTLIVHPEGRT